MKESVFTVCYLFFILTWKGFASSDSPASIRNCANGEFSCQNGNCIPMRWVCDGDDDCKDRSDEHSNGESVGISKQACKTTTCSKDEFVCADGKCIPDKWKCDGELDCIDGSDENRTICDKVKCKNDEFTCGNGLCIPLTWLCDRSDDCSDGSDEKNCLVTCATDEHICNNKKCISKRWVCDGEDDCDDNSDEEGCGQVQCKPDEFKCVGGGECVQAAFRCDGDSDCADKSDELNCTHTEGPIVVACSASDFTCASGDECIHRSWFCDGDADCLDASDESDVTCKHTCRTDQFMCRDQLCVYSLLRCDGVADCNDGSDEDNCTTPTPRSCKADEFPCNEEGMCIPMNKVCDGHPDCPENQDEKPEKCKGVKDPCLVQNGGCSHTCVNLHNGERLCECPPGLELMSDNKVCDDVNECLQWGVCPQKCENTKGSYKCVCEAGYVRILKNATSDVHCAALGPTPFLLFSNHKDIRRLNPKTLVERKLYRSAQNAIAMDYDISRKLIYWSDVSHARIYRAQFSDDTFSALDGVPQPVHENIKIPDGLAVDWIHENIYWSDADEKVIAVSKTSGGMKRTLVRNLEKPRAVAVDPRKGWVYWSDWGNQPKIGRCGMNGAQHQILIQEDIQWPNGLTLDFSTDRLYWVDAKLHTITSSKFDGQDRRNILYDPIKISHPFAITVFEDIIYWTDWSGDTIRYINKFTGKKVGEHHELLLKLSQPAGIHAVHPYRQPSATNVCGTNNQDCSHLCLPAPQKDDSNELMEPHSLPYSCACPDNYHFNEDGKTCSPVSHVTSSTNLPQVTSTTKHPPVTSTNLPVTSTKLPVISSKSASVTQSTTPIISKPTEKGIKTVNNSSYAGTEPPKPDSTQAPTPVVHHTVEVKNTSDHGGYIHVTEKSGTPEEKDEESVGLITGIVIACVIFVLLLIIVIGYFIYRNHTKRNIRSMNFDNPVYRKTTDDQFGIDKKGSQRSIPSTLQPMMSPQDEVV